MSYKVKTVYKRTYRFDSFDFTVPEFVALLKQKAEAWVIETNKYRRERVDEMRDPKRYSKKELIENEKEIAACPRYYAPVTVNDYAQYATYDCRYQVFINPANGTFNITLKTAMNYMDKLHKGLKKKQEKGEENEKERA